MRDQNPDCLLRVVNHSTFFQTVINNCSSCLETSFKGEKNYLHVAVKQKYLKVLKDLKGKWFMSFQCGPVRSVSGSDSSNVTL